jgi:pilus assembly protein CpaC
MDRRADAGRRRRGWAALLAFVAFQALWPAQALAAKARPAAAPASGDAAVRVVSADASGYGGQLALPIGGSKILKFAQPIGRVLLGEPKVADVVPLSDRTLYVMGKAAGTTNLTVMRGDTATPIATLDLHVGYDVENLKRALSELMPGEPIEVSARGDGLVISGLATNAVVAGRAIALAERYAPDKVLNLMSVKGAEQVQLSVHVAEVQRSALKQLGITTLNAGFDDITGGVTPPDITANPDALLNLFGRGLLGQNIRWDALLEALEKKGFASTLAEPKLTALSGETAVFFAGGEFPVPVPQTQSAGQTTLTIEYKEYGVRVGFTPTVFGDTINLVVSPEVSALDQQNSVQLQGFKVPGLTTRRARTVVELKNGQSFAIAGLIRRDFSDSLRGVPGASSLPIFGARYRSTHSNTNETEVVIIVTVHLAKPTDRRNLLLPTDTRAAPSEAELLLLGRTDKPVVANPGSKP